jgi:sugar lactone lactonase YvrE
MKYSVYSFAAKFLTGIVLITFASCSNKDNPGPSPIIRQIYPTFGVVGSSVIINGDQFIPAVPPDQGVGPWPNTSIVTFNGTMAEADYVYQDSAGKQRINTKVPAGATSGKITVTANGKTVSSLDDFNVTAPIYLPNVEVTTVSGYGKDVAFDGAGNLYLTHKEPNEIVKITPDGKLHTLWSSTTGEIPWGITVDAKGNIFATVFGSYILKIDSDGNVTTLAGSTESGDVDGQGSSARFNFPFGIAVGKDGNLYVADTFNHKIRKITPDGTVSTLAGSTMGFKDGTGTNAQFGGPNDVILDGTGNIFVTDGNRIRKVTSDGQVSTLAGSAQGYLDGTTASAQFNQLTGIVIDATDNLYVCDAGNYVVRRITPDGNVATVAGSIPGNVDGPGSSAQFDFLFGITTDAGGTFYLAQAEGPLRKIVVH